MTFQLTTVAKLGALLGAALIGASATAEEFKVGAHMPLTGTLARSGQGFNEGIQAAVDIFNRTNGKHKIKMITIDDESAPAKAVAAVEKLGSEGVTSVIGGYGSNIIGPASDTSNRLGLTYITAGGVNDELTKRGYKTFFRINNTRGYETAVTTMLQEVKAQSVSIVYSTKEATSDLAKDIQKTLAAKNVKVTMHAFDPAITDFKPIINKIKLQDKPDVLFMSGYENDYVGIIRAAKVLKPQIKSIVGVWSLATSKMASDFPDLMPNVIGTAMLPFPVEYKTPEGKQFAETYKKMFNKDVDYLAQFGYVKASLLFEAIARAADNGTLKKGGLSDELRKTNRDTLIGKVTFDANGDNPNFQHRMGQHQNGKIAIVSPAAQATAPIKYPALPW
ncbi:ABC transporter substrate-binding protein [Noviherbaspirillum autotrophicum]|uniref:Branched-chain amino acid ABC transporter substrate-binding protein n=1 Tax=Noviherbaspirillum autotrophicum TaxID=709839 RepID=A0A0C2BVL7_9BURK|nr:ABC transporter substrate-binding protein [Noviherbaspirillum autotrophicum]KIF82071.1 branched-chain amino acid ABC transporter substrate-binding protein [Noviherbaspirillum autotrophicum]